MNFISAEEKVLADQFMHAGWVVRPVDDASLLRRIQRRAAETAAAYLGLPSTKDLKGFLDEIHNHIDPVGLNGLRLQVIEELNREPWLRAAYFRLARPLLETLVGNELCMQRRINLSIQLPEDDLSLLPAHADVWSGDSAFEVVVWLPLVDCFSTKSMYLCPQDKSREIQARLAEFRSAEDIFAAISDDVEWLNVPFGQVLIFDQTLIHGNRINREPTTRWSMNCRLKSVLSPYADKKLGEFFEPITLKPVTRRATGYRLPGGYK